MIIDNELLARLEALGKLRLNDGQRESFRNEISEIINYAQRLSAISADGDDELCVDEASAVLREDKAEIFANPEELLENTEATADGCFAVPKAF